MKFTTAVLTIVPTFMALSSPFLYVSALESQNKEKDTVQGSSPSPEELHHDKLSLRHKRIVKEIFRKNQALPQASWEGVELPSTTEDKQIEHFPENLEHQEDEEKDTFLERDIPPLDPTAGAFTDLEQCFLLDDGYLYSNSEGTVVSRIPVSQEQYDNGVFIQNTNETACGVGVGDNSTDVDRLPCMKVGAVFCSLCVFDQEKLEKGQHIYLDMLRNVSLPKCRTEVKNLAKLCEKNECIPGAEPIHRSSNNDENYHSRSRKLLSYDDVLGSNKARWMTTLRSKLGSQRNRITLKDFVLPGSHNSAAVKMSSLYCGPDQNLIPALPIRNRVAKCQQESIMTQLKKGIRYLDLRIIDSPNYYGRRYPLHHSYLIDDSVDTMQDALATISSFLNANPGEFVIARIKTKGRNDCKKDNASYGGWKNEFERLRSRYGRVQRYTNSVLNYQFDQLRGRVFVDIDNDHREAYYGGNGVDGPDYGWNDGNPFEIAKKIHDDQYPQSSSRFDIWSFFPAPSDVQLINLVANPIARFHDGLEDWDANFQKHVWLMHSLIARKGTNVNAILRDRATIRKNIYHVATQLSLYRIFDKMASTSNSWMDSVITHEWVNEWDEKFEHVCPVGWVLQGFQSRHDNGKEDRLWKFQCRRVNWVYRSSWWYGNGRFNDNLHQNVWRKNTNSNTVNSFDGKIDTGWNDCSSAITGIGGVHNNHHEDRKFWFYSSVVKGNKPRSCTWTGWINSYDGTMNWNTKSNEYISRIYSVHNNHHEDRRWKFCTCSK